MKTLRRMVSKKKKRYHVDGFDLDLSYITQNIIAMGLPAQGLQAIYRNPLGAVMNFLEKNHANNYKIFNLCEEAQYSHPGGTGQLAWFPCSDHQVPTLRLIQQFVQEAMDWIEKSVDNVVVVHCKAGKGRTGLFISSLLLFLGYCKTAEEALELFGMNRTKDGKGVTLPSQRRYVQYYHDLAQTERPHHEPHTISNIRLSGLPKSFAQRITLDVHSLTGQHQDGLQLELLLRTSMGQSKTWCTAPCTSGVTASRASTRVFTSSTNDQSTVDIVFDLSALNSVCVQEEVKITVYRGMPYRSNVLFWAWISPGMLSSGSFNATTAELDRPSPALPANFSLSVHFNQPPCLSLSAITHSALASAVNECIDVDGHATLYQVHSSNACVQPVAPGSAQHAAQPSNKIATLVHGHQSGENHFVRALSQLKASCSATWRTSLDSRLANKSGASDLESCPSSRIGAYHQAYSQRMYSFEMEVPRSESFSSQTDASLLQRTQSMLPRSASQLLATVLSRQMSRESDGLSRQSSEQLSVLGQDQFFVSLGA